MDLIWKAATAAALGLGLLGCAREAPCVRCDTIVIAATGEPEAIFPPLAQETVGRDIGDQVYERLANLAPGAASIDTAAYRPGLAARWERVDSVTWRFHLRPAARWHDGQPVTAADVAFSFQAYADSTLETAAGSTLASVTAEAEDSATVRVRFARAYPEELYDATWHVRVVPAHIWSAIPRAQWASDTALGHLVGSGPYRVAAWERGQTLTLVADTTAGPRTRIRTAIWRFAADPEAALNLVMSGEADLLETVGSPERVARVEADSLLRAVRYPSAAYGFLGYQLRGIRAPSRAALSDRATRRALNQAIDRSAIASAVFGPGTKTPPGPMSQLLWIWDDGIHTLPYDTAAASQALDAAGWKRGADGMRRRNGQPLGFDILVPATSPARRRLAEALQEQWRLAGARITVTAVDFPVFQERLAKGQFDGYIGAWLDEPSPRSLAEQWTRAGFGVLNYGGYDSPAFDALFKRALAAGDLPTARAAWREAFDTLNADAPALFLYAPVNVAAVSRRVQGLSIDPYSWLSGLTAVTLGPLPH